MSVELVEKRERRRLRSARHLAHFEQAAAVPYKWPASEMLHHVYGTYAVWDAVRRVASEILEHPIDDVQVAWVIVRFAERHTPALVAPAVQEALRRWRKEVAV